MDFTWSDSKNHWVYLNSVVVILACLLFFLSSFISKKIKRCTLKFIIYSISIGSNFIISVHLISTDWKIRQRNVQSEAELIDAMADGAAIMMGPVIYTILISLIYFFVLIILYFLFRYSRLKKYRKHL